MADDQNHDTGQPRPARGFSVVTGFVARAFRIVFGADHPARRTITPPGFPLRVLATVSEVAGRADHTFLLLTFDHDGATWGAGIRLKPGVTGYAPGDTRPLFLDPAKRRFMFGVVTGPYAPAADLVTPVPPDTPPADHPVRVTATVERVEHWHSTTGTAADLFGGGSDPRIWRTAMVLRFAHAGRDLGAEIALPPGSRHHAPGDRVALDLSPDAMSCRFGHVTARADPWADHVPDDSQDTGDAAPPRMQ